MDGETNVEQEAVNSWPGRLGPTHIFYRVSIVCIVCACFVWCGCRTALSAKDMQAITDFVQKRTGERATLMIQQTDGDVAVQTDMTNGGFNRSHLWLLKRTPGGWKLIELGIVSF